MYEQRREEVEKKADELTLLLCKLDGEPGGTPRYEARKKHILGIMRGVYDFIKHPEWPGE